MSDIPRSRADAGQHWNLPPEKQEIYQHFKRKFRMRFRGISLETLDAIEREALEDELKKVSFELQQGTVDGLGRSCHRTLTVVNRIEKDFVERVAETEIRANEATRLQIEDELRAIDAICETSDTRPSDGMERFRDAWIFAVTSDALFEKGDNGRAARFYLKAIRNFEIQITYLSVSLATLYREGRKDAYQRLDALYRGPLEELKDYLERVQEKLEDCLNEGV